MTKLYTTFTAMIRSNSSRPEPPPPNESVTIDEATFSGIYDRYAPALLGVISAIVRDKAEAIRVLETTFTEINSQYGQPRSSGQPLFIWLLLKARSVALEAARNPLKPSPFVRQPADPTKLGVSVNDTMPVTSPQKRVSSLTNELLDGVLFKNCTPEEAASAIGLPVATARQQLRLAMQQLRSSGKV